MAYRGPSLEVKFRRDYKDPLEAAKEAVATADTYCKAGIPGIACVGGPALYRDYEEILMDYGVELVVATGCELWNYEETWVAVFGAIMNQTWELFLPKYPQVSFRRATLLVRLCVDHERKISRGDEFYIKRYEETETTPRESMHRVIESNINGLNPPYSEKEILAHQEKNNLDYP